MPIYPTQPYPYGTLPILASASWPTYLFGSFANDVAPTRFIISEIALSANVATITGTIVEGNIPAIGSLITVVGSTGNLVDASNVALTGVNITLSTGQGTLSYALTGSNQSTEASGGTAVVSTPEVAENLVNNSSSIAVNLPFNDPNTDGARTVTAVVYLPVVPTAATIDLQGALYDKDSEYQKIANVLTVTAGSPNIGFYQATLSNFKFYRFHVSGLQESSPPVVGTIIAKILA